MNQRLSVLRASVTALALGTVLLAAAAHATVPQAVVVEGLLQSAGGGQAADGNYKLTFALYKDAVGGTPVWTETAAAIAVKGGMFTWQLGSATPLSAGTLSGLPAVYLGLAVEADPELPRKPLSSVPFSLRAGLADGLDCTGCVTLSHLDAKVLEPYAKTADLAKVAKSGAYADLLNAPKLANVAVTGNYTDLTGLPDLAGFASLSKLAAVAKSGNYGDLQGAPDLTGYAKTTSLAKVATSGKYTELVGAPQLGTACGSGLVLRGFKADGAFDCTPSLDVNSLPPDALAKVSNGLLTVQIADKAASTTTPLAIPDNNPQGAVDSITWPEYGTAQTFAVSIDLVNSDVSKVKVVLIAPDKSTLVLYDKSTSGTALKATFTEKSALVSGSLSSWVGKNPKGKWSLQVIDSGFLANGDDGQIKAWSLQVQSLSAKKVQALGGFQFLNATAHPLTCDASQAGFTYYNNAAQALYVCNGESFYPISLVPYGTQANPAASCKDMLVKVSDSKDGAYYVVQGGKIVQVTCDMTSDGGGWTLIDNDLPASGAGWSDGTLTNATVGGVGVAVHGMWGQNGGAAKTYTIGMPHTQTRVKARYYAIDSWDGEGNGAQVILDNGLKWAATKSYNAAGSGPGWVFASFSPAPWGGPAQQGYWNVEAGLGVIAHTADTLKVEFRTGIDQPSGDESFAFSHVQVWVR